MVCYYPCKAYLPPVGEVNPKTGDGRPSFAYSPGMIARGWREITVPCGQCIGCRLDKTASWALRCMHESHLHDMNCFVTLTFNDDNLASDMSLHKEDFAYFMKRLRRYFDNHYGSKLRFFHSGEYGDKNFRPHHHAILFGIDFPDKKVWKQQPTGAILYRSDILEKLWPFGFSSIGNVTYKSCGYVARYCLKKITGKAAAEYYAGRIPPYLTMSRMPGIGRDWFLKYWRDVYPNDFCVTSDGHLKKPPRYYDVMYEYLYDFVADDDLATIDEIKLRRQQKSIEMDEKQFDSEFEKYERLEVRSKVKEYQIQSLRRSL